jgi:hypothetical protein
MSELPAISSERMKDVFAYGWVYCGLLVKYHSSFYQQNRSYDSTCMDISLALSTSKSSIEAGVELAFVELQTAWSDIFPLLLKGLGDKIESKCELNKR